MVKRSSKPAKRAVRKTKAGRKAKPRPTKRPSRGSARRTRPAKRKLAAKKALPRKISSRVLRGKKPTAKVGHPPVAAGKPGKPAAVKLAAKAAAKTPLKAIAPALKTSAKQPLPGKAPGLPGKPSAGEIAARLSARRTEKALAEGKVRSGKNGVEARKVELTPAEAEARKTRLKNLIVLGKERSYLTYAEINDHLPDDILDAEQIEGILSMINDMGIQVYDEAPDAETLLMSEAAPATAAEDVDEEAAEAAASTLDSEFGRTTDPVRMYMREMGSVELLTREGEIEIAKRIEEGLKHMIMAISACPMTVAQILDLAAKIEKDELKIDDLVDGLMDFNEALDTFEDVDGDVEASEDEGDAGAIAAENLERLKVAALARF